MDKFKKRNFFKSYRLFSESIDFNIEGIISEVPKLWKKISEYTINDVLIAGEFGSFYKLASDSNIEPSRLAERKNPFSLLACVNGWNRNIVSTFH